MLQALATFAPGIFTVGSGRGAIIDTSHKLVDSTNPAKAGSAVTVAISIGGVQSNTVTIAVE